LITAKFDFKNLVATGEAFEDGDTAFDREEFSAPSLPGLQVVSLYEKRHGVQASRLATHVALVLNV
jgi:hypothetical protein